MTRAVLLDLEGTLFANGTAIAGAARAIEEIRLRGHPLRFCTNIDSRTPTAIAAELSDFGIDVPVGDLFTPVVAARVLFADSSARVLPFLTRGLHGEIPALTQEPPYTHVLVGDYQDVLSYEVLDEAFRALRAGAELVALQRGRYYRRPDGDHVDTGAIVAGLEYSAGVKARVLGKPSIDFFALAARSLGVELTDCVVVGDDSLTDIEGGRAAGTRTVQVRTGKYAAQHAEGITGKADVTINSIRDLPELLE